MNGCVQSFKWEFVLNDSVFAGTTRGAAITTTTSVGARTLGPTAEGARWQATIHTTRTETAEATSPVTEAGTGTTGDKLSTLLIQKFYTCKNNLQIQNVIPSSVKKYIKP